jgi:hypothetical protein
LASGRVLTKIFGPKSDGETEEYMRNIKKSFTNYYLSYKIKNKEMGGPCSRYGGEEKCISGFGEET